MGDCCVIYYLILYVFHIISVFFKFVIVPTLIYASETLMWIEGKKSNIQGVDMSCLRDACGVKN